MSNFSLTSLIAGTLVGAWYSIGALWTVHKKGFDPSLLTYLSPLPLANFIVARLLMLVIMFMALNEASHPLLLLISSAIVLGFAAAHTVLLVAFGRTGTQPMLYYGLLTVAGAVGVVGFGTTVLVPLVLTLAVMQEVSLQYWLKNRTRHYNQWVAAKVRRIHAAYSYLTDELTDQEWFYVLHFAVTESIARPKLSRLVESLYFHLKHPATISSGIMQVQAPTLLSDQESMRRGSHIVRDAVRHLPGDMIEPIEQLKWLAQAYNGSLNSQANADYTGYLLATYPGLLVAWESLASGY